MTYSEAQKRAVQKYRSKNYDEIKLYVAKGDKDVIKAKAAELGLSMNEFINQAIKDAMQRP